MSLRFHQRISLFPGVRLNLSRSGVSVSLGVPGATLNFGGHTGPTVTVGVPGTGLSYRHQLAGRPKSANDPHLLPTAPPPPTFVSNLEQGSLPGEIKSAGVSMLTTPDLEGLKRLLNDAAGQRRDFEESVAQALKVRDRTWRNLERARKLPLKLFLAGRVPQLETNFQQAQNRLEEEVEKLNACHVQIDFAFDPITMGAYESLIEAHRVLRASERIWDVTSSIFIDRVITRSTASSLVTRKPHESPHFVRLEKA
jgi:hypothetical protein